MAETTEHHCSNGNQNRHFTLVAFVNENTGKHHLEERKLEIFPFYIYVVPIPVNKFKMASEILQHMVKVRQGF